MTLYGMRDYDLGEPKVYGGYGMGATATQQMPVEYEDCCESDAVAKKGKGVKVVDWKKRYPSVKAAAKALGVDDQVLGRKLRRNNGRAVLDGVVVELA